MHLFVQEFTKHENIEYFILTSMGSGCTHGCFTIGVGFELTPSGDVSRNFPLFIYLKHDYPEPIRG